MQDTNIIGRRFGILTVINRDYNYVNPKHTKWICLCDCGNIKSIFRNSLIGGRTQSCGCMQNKGKKGINQTHGLSKTRIYHEWASMRRRCKQNSTDAKSYFYRGISVCEEWENNFMAFYEWSIHNGYSDSLTIDRINNDMGYSPENCQWITNEKQQSNKSNTVKVRYNGKDYCLRSLCRELNFPYKTAHKRYQKMKAKNNFSIEKLFAPINNKKSAVSPHTKQT